MKTDDVRSTMKTSLLYKAGLNPPAVMSFETVAAQQTGEGIYSILVNFKAVGSVIRTKYGHDIPPCNSTCAPSTAFPVLCNSPSHPHQHLSNDMLPVLFTVVPANCSEDIGPLTPDGVIIPPAITIGTQVMHQLLPITFILHGSHFSRHVLLLKYTYLHYRSVYIFLFYDVL